MKKLLCFTLTVVMVLALNLTAYANAGGIDFAENDNFAEGYSQTLSEYEILKSLKGKTDEQLKLQGYEIEDIAQIRAIDLIKLWQNLKVVQTGN